MLYYLPAVSLDDISPNGEGSIRRYFCGDEVEAVVDIWAHRLLLGDAGFINGSNSIVLFKVAPQAIPIITEYRSEN